MAEKTVGIMGLGTYIPRSTLSAAQISRQNGIPEQVIVEKFGVSQKPVPGAGDTTSYMGLKAAQKALENAGVSPEELDLVIWNGAQHKDYPCWLASLKIAHELGATNAWGFDMEAMCGSMMVGMETAKSLMLGSDSVRTVLLVSGYRNLDLINLQDAGTSFMHDIGAGGAAMVLRKGYPFNEVLGSAFRGDGSFSEDCVVPVGGTCRWPMQPEDVSRMYFQVQGDAKSFKTRLGEKTMPTFFWVIRESLRRSGLSQENIDYLAILHFKKSAHMAVLEELKLSEEKTTYLQEYGHIGQNDQVLSLELGLEQGKIKDGDVIVMVGAGLGFVWASSVVRWGPVVQSPEKGDQR
ncbi:MAG TPA: 3-oxoacyl-ACP synthase [Thermotogota bacterium]|nr:3-oxoacyl-ACP synthase [Thermotogota bacterium]HRW92596.1 3-oxoacyl-ACP synthase [Thermotogota bacterium]